MLNHLQVKPISSIVYNYIYMYIYDHICIYTYIQIDLYIDMFSKPAQLGLQRAASLVPKAEAGYWRPASSWVWRGQGDLESVGFRV